MRFERRNDGVGLSYIPEPGEGSPVGAKSKGDLQSEHHQVTVLSESRHRPEAACQRPHVHVEGNEEQRDAAHEGCGDLTAGCCRAPFMGLRGLFRIFLGGELVRVAKDALGHVGPPHEAGDEGHSWSQGSEREPQSDLHEDHCLHEGACGGHDRA